MPKTRRSAITENAKNLQGRGHVKCEKLAGPRSWKNAKNSQVRGHGICQKTSRFAVAKRWKKCIGQHLCKNPKNSQVCSHGEYEKIRRSAFTQKCQKLVGQRSRKMAKTRRSAVTEVCQKTSKIAVTKNKNLHTSAFMQKPKNSHVRGHGKCQKL